jgi:hypothetical protein
VRRYTVAEIAAEFGVAHPRHLDKKLPPTSS